MWRYKAKKLDLESLTSRRLFNYVIANYKLISGLLICPDFLNKINFKVPAFNLKNNPPFPQVCNRSRNLVVNRPGYRHLNNYNSIPNLNFCFDSLVRLDNIVMNISEIIIIFTINFLFIYIIII